MISMVSLLIRWHLIQLPAFVRRIDMTVGLISKIKIIADTIRLRRSSARRGQLNRLESPPMPVSGPFEVLAGNPSINDHRKVVFVTKDLSCQFNASNNELLILHLSFPLI
jgi:hypothetical protein